jgi:predicted lipoprotein
VLEALARDVLGGMARDAFREASALHGAVQELCHWPDPTHHAAARRALAATLLSWKRAYAFRSGPFARSRAFQRAAFWPVSTAAVDAVLASQRPLAEHRVKALGVDAKGLFALEYVLFAAPFAGHLSDPVSLAGERARRFARELSTDVLAYAQRAVRLLGDGEAYAAGFARAGQQSIAELLAQSIDTVDIVAGKLDRVVRAAAQERPRSLAVEGYFSGMSLAIASALVDGTRQLYLGRGGGGLAELVAHASVPVDAHARALFADVEASLGAVGKPLEIGVDTAPERIPIASASLAALARLLNGDVRVALDAAIATHGASGPSRHRYERLARSG